MSKLLKFEWRKLWQSKSFYIIFGLGLLSTILFMILGKVLTDVFATPDGNPLASMLVVLSNSGFVSLLGVYLVIFACADYSQQTIKNIYARGYSRTAVYFSKYLISLLVTWAVALFYMVFSFLFALVLGGHIAVMSSWMWGYLALQFWVLVGMHGLYFGMAMIFGKTRIGIIANVVGVELFFTLLHLLIQIIKINFNILDYNLEMILATLMGDHQLGTAGLVRVLVMPAVYAVVFVGGGWLASYRREV